MASEITKQELEHLARLARIELDPTEQDKLLKDLGSILEYFKELQTIDTSKVAPMTGGTELMDIFRNDEERENTNQGDGVASFPEAKDGFLKVPPVFE